MVWGLFPVDPLSGGDNHYIFTKGNYKIGRKGCDIIINKDKGVSRIHAELTVDATSVSTSRGNNKSSETTFVIRVKDCSKHGTFIKTQLEAEDKVHELPTKEKILNDGDVITFGTGAATYRFSLIPLVFYFCPPPSSKTFMVDRSIQEAVSSIGARIVTTLSEECTHVLVEPRMQVNEALVNSVLSKKPIVLTNWVTLLAEKSIRSVFPENSLYRPSVMVDEALVDVMEPNIREKCLEGFTFLLESTDTYKFGSSFSSLLEACGAKITSMSQESQFEEEINRTICVIAESSGDKSSRLKHLRMLSRVNEMDLLRAILSGNLPSTSLIPPSPLHSGKRKPRGKGDPGGGIPWRITTSTSRFSGRFDNGASRDRSQGQFGKASPSKDVEGTKTLVVHGYPIETTEEEIRDAFGDGRKPMHIYTGSLTVATFPEEEHAAKALQFTIGIDGFSVEFAQDNDLYDLGRSLHARVPAHAQLRPMAVIWDWENCTIPATFPVDDLYENVQKYLYERNFYISSFNGYGDRKALNDEKFATLSKQGKIKLNHVDPSDDRDAADIEAKKALLQIMTERLPPSPSLVFSGDQDFMKVILSLRKRNYEVYLAHNDIAPDDLKNSATKCCPYEDPFGIDRSKLAKPKGRGGKARKKRKKERLEAPTDGEDQKMDEA